MAERIRRPVWFFVLILVTFGGVAGLAVFAENRPIRWSDAWLLIVVFVGLVVFFPLGYWVTQNFPTDDPEEE